MGSCSTNHIIVTRKLMARKKAQRAYINEKIFFYHNDDWYSSGCSFLGNTLG